MGYHVMGGGRLMKDEDHENDEGKKKNGNGNGSHSNGNGNGNGSSNGSSNGGGGNGVSEAWSAKYKKSIDCNNPKGFSQRAHCGGRKKVSEATMSPAQKRKDTMLKKKYDESDMKQNMIDQYGKEEGTKIYFATIRKQAMDEELDSKDKPFIKKLVGKLRKGSKTHAKQADDLEKAMNEESNPRIPRKEGQPANSKKHSDLYTDENPKGTIHGLGFKDVATAKASVAKIKKSSRSHAHKIQAAIAMEQRARVMGKTSEAAVFRKFINSMKKKTKQMNEAKGGDHEVAMAQSQLKKSEENIKKLRKALGKKEKDIPAWMQAKITDTAHDTDAAAGYVDKMDEEVIAEKRDGKSAKDKGYSLRDWFKGGGWVQAGGKYDGKPCARQPGQKTKPFCRDADDRANMSKKERERRAKKKRREDPIATRKGKAKMVSASYSNWRNELQLNEGMGLGIAAGAAALAAAPYLAKKFLKPKADKALQRGRNELHLKGNPIGAGARGLDKQSYEPEGEVVTERDAWGTGPCDNIRCADGKVRSPQELEKLRQQNLKKKGITLDKAHYEPEGDLVDEGKKDACYYKVKSRYSVWPSAYASGALVKCRKVGAKNWGNKTKKEGYEFSNWRDDFQATEYESVDIIKAEPLKPTDGIGSRMLGEAKKCWKGYKKVGTQKLFGKTYNRCEKIKKEEVEIQEAIPGYDKYDAAMENIRSKGLKGSKLVKALKDAALLRPKTEKEVDQKIPESHELGEDWQKSNRNDGVDGMSQKSVNAYKRENPGSKLKTAVTGKVKKGSKDAKRRKSFCARSDGQRKMHNIDCKKTPDKKICKARRRWKC